MARSASTVAALGDGRFDGEEGVILLGSDDSVELTWVAADSRWRGDEAPLVELHTVAMDHFGPANEWKYLFFAAGNLGAFNRTDMGFNPAPIRNAATAYAAGLTLQELMVGVLWNNSGSGNAELAIVQYPFGDGDGISGTIYPDPYVSTVLTGTTTREWVTAGWQDSALTEELIDDKPVLAPHLYTRYTTGSDGPRLARLLSKWRWVGTP